MLRGLSLEARVAFLERATNTDYVRQLEARCARLQDELERKEEQVREWIGLWQKQQGASDRKFLAMALAVSGAPDAARALIDGEKAEDER